MELFDSHAHYNDEKFDNDRSEIIEDIYNFGITKIINAGYSLSSSKKALEIANKYEFMYSIVGVSPNDIKDLPQNYIEQIKQMASDKKVVAIGEIGLDYYWNKENKDKQKEIFIEQIKLANELNLPIVIHSREAVFDTLNILKNEIEAKNKGIFHCCQLNVDLVREAIKLGFYISFAGPVTFKNSKNAEEVVKLVPLDKILIETDSPYLSPEPKRGTRNDSRNVKFIAQKIADIKQLDINEIAKITYNNAEKIFNI